MEHLAFATGTDPLEMREKNMVRAIFLSLSDLAEDLLYHAGGKSKSKGGATASEDLL